MMNITLNRPNLQQNNEDEDDDCSNYFLQPASSPYNIAEKVQQANIDLYNDDITIRKTSKVKFRDELTSFEPDSTDDDVNSIESEEEEIATMKDEDDGAQILEYKSVSFAHLNIPQLVKEEDELGEDEEIKEEKDMEDMESSSEKDEEITSDNITELFAPIEEKKDLKIENLIRKPLKYRKSMRKKPKSPSQINCKKHCLERIDFDLSMSIKKLEIHEKPANCPILKLQPRKCCDESHTKSLPKYDGLRSEYGLSLREIEDLEKRKQTARLREQKRKEIIEEYRRKRVEENEKVFSQWLRDVARRKVQKQNVANDVKSKTCFSPKVINFPNKTDGKMVERPKTANEFVPIHQIKKARRPHTSHTSVFIEVPQKLLHRGINLGDLLVRDGKCLSAKKLHILTYS